MAALAAHAGAALLAATLAVGAVLVAILMAFLGGGSHKQRRGRRR